MDSISRMITEFSLDLYNKVNRTTECQNIVFSPMSISTSLGLILLGARNNTATQIENVLHVTNAAGTTSLESELEGAVPENKSELSQERESSSSLCNTDGNLNHEAFHALLLQLQNLGKDYVLSLANNLFIQQGFEPNQKYLTCSKELYRAALETLDFQRALEASRLKINDWVESETQGKIKELFAPGVIDSHAILVLVNVIYFKASWEHKFEEKNTVQRDFKLNQTESTMTYENLMLWFSSEHMFETTVEVYLPRFKLEDTFNLNEVLKAMGMTDIFTESKADLSALSSGESLVLSNIVHKAYVEVNEEGTTAAAATGATIVRRSLPLIEVFMADHPFLFFIRHNPTNAILFFGKFCSP
ncbi:serpin B12-like isoform X2 [Tympanuchus pallidicinctus]|uniref:serpin B12-like isoform X2 n=1 Tax=Tympanuchus pallidicinctus TaxID=109042 RepID=UPI0022872CC7|nr:serpin B12-like isoform X2 [Tympanuchus pallidicinctus]